MYSERIYEAIIGKKEELQEIMDVFLRFLNTFHTKADLEAGINAFIKHIDSEYSYVNKVVMATILACAAYDMSGVNVEFYMPSTANCLWAYKRVRKLLKNGRKIELCIYQ